MTSIVINLAREAKHWTIHLAINGEVQPRAVFACTEALSPLVRGLMSAESENRAVWATTQAHAPIRPSTITVGFPSGRVLTFALTSVQEALSNAPEGLSG